MPAPTKRTTTKATGGVRWSSPWTKMNYTVLGIGVATIVLGFLLLATGIGQWDNPLAVDVAPVVLVVGYCVIVPYAVIRYGGDKPQDNQ
ncbi:MAG: DUF3098 domain-containing protein [Candidatus Kapabacteria bacterium]|nr:DUF3098 domain-containing protein [Candidatus Kapabacteria bacterium]